jgi:dTDP-4-dehydrorhamnose reductase
LVGASLCRAFEAGGARVVRQGRREGAELRVDPGDPAALASALATVDPDTIVNLAAATHVDRCEDDPGAAFLANVRLVEGIAAAIGSGGRPHLIQVSTDQVYDGAGPHHEDDARPCNVYALTKYAGELACAGVAATVLRTNLFGRSRSPGRSSLSDWVVQSLRAGQRITVFDDVLFSPLHLDSLAEVIVSAARLQPSGVFNAGSRDGVSKAGFALELAQRLGLDRSLMTVGASSSAGLRARRPLDMRMNPDRFDRHFDIASPTIESQIERAAEEYRHEPA